MKLRFTAKVLVDLERLHEFVAEKSGGSGSDSPLMAGEFSDTTKATLRGKQVTPLPVHGWVAGDYVVRNLIEGEQCLIMVRIWHG